MTTTLPVKPDSRPEPEPAKVVQPPAIPEVALSIDTVPAPVIVPVRGLRLAPPATLRLSESVAPELTVMAETEAVVSFNASLPELIVVAPV